MAKIWPFINLNNLLNTLYCPKMVVMHSMSVCSIQYPLYYALHVIYKSGDQFVQQCTQSLLSMGPHVSFDKY